MTETIDFMKRNGLWLLLTILSLLLLKPSLPEWKTIWLIVTIESIAIALSGAAAFAYTKIDFTYQRMENALGFIFLGVHICVGLIVLGVYLATFSN
jgi:hypothetical protein